MFRANQDPFTWSESESRLVWDVPILNVALILLLRQGLSLALGHFVPEDPTITPALPFPSSGQREAARCQQGQPHGTLVEQMIRRLHIGQTGSVGGSLLRVSHQTKQSESSLKVTIWTDVKSVSAFEPSCPVGAVVSGGIAPGNHGVI